MREIAVSSVLTMLMNIRKLRNIMRLTLLVPRLINLFVSLLSR